MLTTTRVPTLRPDTDVRYVSVPEAFWNFQELPAFVINDAFAAAGARAVGGRRVALVYQRYSLNSYAGLRLAHRLGVPFVLEYNGSEIWIARHWGRPVSRATDRHPGGRVHAQQRGTQFHSIVCCPSRVGLSPVSRLGVEALELLS